MCFNAEVSFAAAGAVGAVGLVGLRGVRRPAELVLATLPLGFAVQQAAEGVTWSLLGDDGQVCVGPSVRTWVVVAWVLVPIWLSVGIALVEPDPRRRRVMAWVVALGLVVAPLWLHLALAPEVMARVVPGPHLEYPLPDLSLAWLVAPYLLVALGPPLASTVPTLRWLGVAGIVSLALAVAIGYLAWPSVWCLAAAALSVLVVVALQRDDRLATAVRPGAHTGDGHAARLG